MAKKSRRTESVESVESNGFSVGSVSPDEVSLRTPGGKTSRFSGMFVELKARMEEDPPTDEEFVKVSSPDQESLEYLHKVVGTWISKNYNVDEEGNRVRNYWCRVDENNCMVVISPGNGEPIGGKGSK